MAEHPAGPGMAWSPPAVARERGMATAELAVAMPAVVLVLALCVGALGLVIDQVRLVDAARAAARSQARGDPVGRAGALVGELGPPGAGLTVSSDATTVSVTVSAERPLLRGPGAALGSMTLSARAVAAREGDGAPP